MKTFSIKNTLALFFFLLTFNLSFAQTPCPKGTFSATGNTPCDPCPAGRFNPSTGQTFCLACPVGRFNPLEGQESCFDCAQGTFSASQGASECDPCEIGTFNPNEGANGCQDCPTNTSTPSTGSIDVSNCSIILPIELIYFKSSFDGKVISLDWATASEINFSHFTIERSFNAKTFEEIGRVYSTGATAGSQYAFQEEPLKQGLSYYFRLKLVDLDGTYEYSKMLVVQLDQSSTKLTLSPNPSQDHLQIFFEETLISNKNVAFLIVSSQGKVVKSGTILALSDTIRLDIHTLDAGVYYLNIEVNGTRTYLKFVVL